MPDSDARLWAQMLAHVQAHHPGLWRHWFDQIGWLGFHGGVLRLRVSEPLQRNYLRSNGTEAFEDAARHVTGHLVTVRFVGDGDEEDFAQGLSGAARNGHAVTRSDLVLDPDNTFENFVEGPGNRLAHAAALGVAEKPGSYNPLFIYGRVGLGKTHLLQATCLRILQNHPGTTLSYVSCEEYMTQYFAAMQTGELMAFRQKFREVGVLVIDDIHFLTKRERSQEEFFHTFNSLFVAGKQIILSSDAAPEVIPDLEARLISRFKQGMVAELEPPDFETRAAIIRQKAKLRGLALPEDAVLHIATCVENNIREIEGTLTSLQLLARVEKRAPDLAMARAAVGEPQGGHLGEVTFHIITSAVTEFFNAKLTDLQSKKRHRSITVPRQVCMYLMKHNTRHSLQEIGGYFGGRDHTTVIHAIEKVQELRSTDPTFDEQLKKLQEQINKHKRL
ncbi:MAG: chromosomal replication initiator protein DnaA [Phycisphaeraceae bacterium]|nr:chromosomal replication initiator protein DnaA [Phycisphaeraceae bacterium]